MRVEIEVELAAARALRETDQIFNNLERARIAAAAIRIPAASGGVAGAGGTGSTTAATQSTAATNALAAAIARQRATAATAQAATNSLNNAISSSVAASSAASRSIQQLAIAQAAAAQAAANATANSQNNAAQMNAQAGAVAGLLGRLASLTAGYLTLRGAWNFAADSVRQTIAFENLGNTMAATTGSAVQAASDLAYLRAEAQRIGIDFLNSAQGFTKFAVAVQGAGMSGQFARETFTALSEASRRLGLGAPQQAAVFLALEQMISKGVVSAQELRLQLGNALPGAFGMAARAMGVTNAELMKLVETGNLMSSEFLPKFISQLSKEMPATAETLASTAAELNRLGNAWTAFKANIGGGLTPATRTGSNLAGDILERANVMMGDKNAKAELDRFIKTRQELEQRWKVENGKVISNDGGDILGMAGLFGGNDPRAIIALEDELARKRASREAKQAEQTAQIATSDTITDDALDKWRKFNEAQIEISRQTRDAIVDDEAKKRNAINDRFDDALAKLQQNKAGLTPAQIASLMPGIESARQGQLQKFDADLAAKENVDSLKAAKEQLAAMNAEARTLAEVRLKIIPDDEARRLAEVNRQFDELRDKLLLVELGNPSAVSENDYQQLEATRQNALQNLRRPKSPVNFVGQDFGGLVGQRESLKQSLLTETDVETFQQSAQKIAEINQALLLQLQSGNVSLSQSFTFGFEEVAESYGTLSQRMAQIGADTAASIETNLTDALTTSILHMDDAGEAFKQMGETIMAELLRIALREIMVKQIVQGLSTFAGSFGGAAPQFSAVPTGHRGMVVGSEGMTSQFLARRHGGGPVGDEQMIMARRGEVVFTPEQMKMLKPGEGGGKQPIQLINLFDRKTFDDMRAANPDAVVNEIGRNKNIIRQILQ